MYGSGFNCIEILMQTVVIMVIYAIVHTVYVIFTAEDNRYYEGGLSTDHSLVNGTDVLTRRRQERVIRTREIARKGAVPSTTNIYGGHKPLTKADNQARG